MKKKLIRNFKQELKNLEKSVENQNETLVSGGVVGDDEYQEILKESTSLYCILDFLFHTGIIESKKYIRYKSRIWEAEHWCLPSTADNEAFM